MRHPWKSLLPKLILAAISGMGLSAGSCTASWNSGSGTTPNASATGIWSGSDSASNLRITALINSAGQATFIRSDGVQFAGSVQVSGGALAATVGGYTDFPAVFGDHSNSGTGTLQGSVTTAGALEATLSFTTKAGAGIPGSWSLAYQPRSNDTSSPAAISGNYTDHVSGTVLSISTSGVMTSQNATNGCVLNGSISTGDSAHDIYEVAFTYGDCTGASAPLNGVQFSGLASLDPEVAPAQLTMAVIGSSPAGNYGVVSAFSAS